MPEPQALTPLQRLEAESIHILREVVAAAAKPVMLRAIGKVSAVLLHLARKAFHPAPPSFPLPHVDTTWKFRDICALRECMARESGMPLHTDPWKTQGLKQAPGLHGFDAAFGGGRRDGQKSRARERIVSLRSAQHRWGPRRQRPAPWNPYNVRRNPAESLRVFPLSGAIESQANTPDADLHEMQQARSSERQGRMIDHDGAASMARRQPAGHC